MFSSKVTFFSARIPGGSGRSGCSERARVNGQKEVRGRDITQTATPARVEPSKPRWLVEVLSLMAFVETKVQPFTFYSTDACTVAHRANEGSRMVHKQFS